jgi:hypothetical protein
MEEQATIMSGSKRAIGDCWGLVGQEVLEFKILSIKEEHKR